MPTIAEVRQKFPQYEDLSDDQLAEALHRKFYSDMPREEFNQRIGLSPEMTQPIDVAREKRVQDRANTLFEARKGALGAATEGAFRGAGVNMFDNIANALFATGEAGVSALTGGEFNPVERFGEMQDAEKLAMSKLREANPVAMASGEVLGGLATAGKLSGAPAMGVSAPTRGAVQSFMQPSTGGLLAQAGKGAAQGAATGAAYALGDGEDPTTAAGFGAAIGAAIPVVGRGLQIAGQTAKNAVAPYINPERFAAGKVVQRLGLDNMTPDQVGNRLARNPGLNVADVAGENTKGLVRTAVNVPGPARTRVTSQMNIRQMGQGDRVGREVAAAFGDPAAFQSTLDDTVNTIKTQASPLYQKAFKEAPAVDVSGVVQAIDDRIMPGVNKIVSPADNLADDSVTAAIARLRSRFLTGTNQRVGLQDLHLQKMDLDGMIEKAKRAGEATKVRALVQVKNELLKAMDAASPDYKTARGIFAGEMEVQNALDAGLSYATNPASLTARDIAKMSKAERDAFRIGVARGLREVIDKSPDGADVVKRIFGSRSKRAALEPLFDNVTDRARFQNAMIREARATKTRQAVIGNSTTARQQADMEDAGIALGTALDVGTGGIAGAIKNLIARAGARIGGVTPEVADQIARLTMTRNPGDLQRAVGILRARGASMQQAQAIANSLRQALTQQGGQQVAISR